MPIIISVLAMISGILGVVVAGVSAYFVHKSKIEPYKLSIHSKQTEAAVELIEALIECQSAVTEEYYSLPPDSRYISDDMREEYRRTLKNPKETLRKKLERWAIILPSEVFQPIVHYLSILEYSMGHRYVSDPWAGSSYPKDEPWMFLSRYFHKSIIEMRRFIGIEPLGLEISKTFNDLDKLETREGDLTELDTKNILLVYLFSKEYVPYGGYRYLEPIRNPEQM